MVINIYYAIFYIYNVIITSKEIRTLTVERPRFPKNHSATNFDILALYNLACLLLSYALHVMLV